MDDHDDKHDNAELRSAIIEALRIVIDPELGRNIVDLGLIYSVSVLDGGIAHVMMTTTSKGCPATGYLKEAVCSCVWNVPGIEYAEVRLTYEPPWKPELMERETNPLFAAHY